jgi:hypothetical protein
MCKKIDKGNIETKYIFRVFFSDFLSFVVHKTAHKICMPYPVSMAEAQIKKQNRKTELNIPM